MPNTTQHGSYSPGFLRFLRWQYNGTACTHECALARSRRPMHPMSWAQTRCCLLSLRAAFPQAWAAGAMQECCWGPRPQSLGCVLGCCSCGQSLGALHAQVWLSISVYVYATCLCTKHAGWTLHLQETYLLAGCGCAVDCEGLFLFGEFCIRVCCFPAIVAHYLAWHLLLLSSLYLCMLVEAGNCIGGFARYCYRVDPIHMQASLT